MLCQKIDHEPIEQPRLLDHAGVTGSRKCLQFTLGDSGLERERPLMTIVFAARQNNSRAIYRFKVAFGIRLSQSFELMNDRLRIRVLVSFAEEIREKMRQRCRPEACAQILERVSPAVIDALCRVVGDPPLREFL